MEYLNGWILLMMLTYINGYDRKCPHPSQWDITSSSYGCPDQKVYICLLDELESSGTKAVTFRETCGSGKSSREGYKYILTPNLYQVQCAESRYQPFAFTTDGNSQCVFSKSLCKAIGQVLENNGRSFTDRSCRCDYRQNYDYVITPKDPCSCKPSEEDCSCYIRKCEDDKVMIADYRCVKNVEAILPEDIKCPVIDRIVSSEETDTVYLRKFQPNSVSSTWAKQASVFLIVVVLIYTVFIGFLFCCVPHVNRMLLTSTLELFLKRTENKFMVLSGDNVIIECTVMSYLSLRSVTWEKERNGDFTQITSSNEKYEIVCGKKPCLKINYFNSDDEGNYRCYARNVVGMRNGMFGSCMNYMSRVDWLTGFVKVLQHIPALHTEDIILHTYEIGSQSKADVCTYEGGTVSMKNCLGDDKKLTAVKWFKENSRRIELDLSNVQYSGGVHAVPALTIKDITLEDAGTYSCILLYDDGKTMKSSFKLKIIPQAKTYEVLLEHRKDEKFIRPAICDTIDKKLQEHNIVVITGRKGTGKSKISLELASIYNEKGYMVMKVDPSEHYAIYRDIYQAFLIIDDDQYKQNYLKVFIENFLPVLLERNIKILLTCRSCELEILKCMPELNRLKEGAFIDINSCLTVEEKENILKRYLEIKNIAISSSKDSNFRDSKILTDLSIQVTLDEDAITKIKNEEPWNGFPLSVLLFCSDRTYLHLGEKYFTNPPKYLLDELTELYKSAKKQTYCIDKISEYCVLAYIMKYHELDLNDTNLYKRLTELYQTFFNYQYIPRKPGTNEDQKIATEEILQIMNNKYLKFQEGIYEFIHPCLFKAMYISSEKMADELLQNGSLHDITEFVRSKSYAGLENELFINVDEKYHQILCERLMRHAFEDKPTMQHVVQYISTYWRSGNTLLKTIFQYIECNLYRSIGIRTGNLQPLENDSFSENEMKEYDQVTFYNITFLLDELTYNGRDPWIYGDKTSDLLILGGLVTAAMGSYATNNRKKTFEILLSEFQRRMPSTNFVKLWSYPLDKYKNTFFHYLMLFSQIEACQVVSVIEKRKYIFHKKKSEEFTPLNIAAYLGKHKVLKELNVKTNCTKALRERLQRLARNGKDDFYNKSMNSGNSDQTAVQMIKDDCADSELVPLADVLCFDALVMRVVVSGRKEDYDLSIELLSK